LAVPGIPASHGNRLEMPAWRAFPGHTHAAAGTVPQVRYNSVRFEERCDAPTMTFRVGRQARGNPHRNGAHELFSTLKGARDERRIKVQRFL
jgi:hypothetical protein